MLYDNINALCAEIGTTPTKFTTEVLKLSSSKVTAWKNGSIPKYEVLQAIADYFHVTIGYLIEAAIHNAKINKQEDCRIDNSINDYMANYLTTYKSVLNYLNDQK